MRHLRHVSGGDGTSPRQCASRTLQSTHFLLNSQRVNNTIALPHNYHFPVVDILQIFARFFVVRRVLKCRKAIRSLPLSASLCAVLLLPSCTPLLTGIPLRQVRLPQAHLSQSPAPQYFSPLQNAEYVSKAATILVRYGPILSAHDIDGLKFQIQGSRSNDHAGQTILADDHKTVIFKPDNPFTPGERVTVSVGSLILDEETSYPAFSYTFTVAINQQPGTPGSSSLAAPPVPEKPPRSAFPDFLTVPQDIPHYTVSKTSPGSEEGYLFVAPFYWTKAKVGSYLLILNGQGQLVYYQSVADALDAWDFKEQPNGLISYYDQKHATFLLRDSHYQMVDTYGAGDGYEADLHDFQFLPNGNALLMAYDAETVDMSRIVLGGKKDATVTGVVIQELDPSKNVIFEWRSWDHFSFFDSTSSLMDQKIDLVHGNSLALSTDGNLLLSSRNLSEITKINLQTGDVIWRMGGKANMFTFTNSQPFAYQHDVRQLPNGNVTVFDNQGTPEAPMPSWGMEYKINEADKTVTQVWGFTDPLPVFATYMGNAQRLPNGNTLLSWGAPFTKKGYGFVSVTEVTPDHHILFELTFDQPYVSYRAFRSAWRGYPDTLPALAAKVNAKGITLGYSWNGDTEAVAYKVYGGDSVRSLGLIEEKTKADFETQSHLTGLPERECYFQVAAMDQNGHELARSKVISTDRASCPVGP